MTLLVVGVVNFAAGFILGCTVAPHLPRILLRRVSLMRHAIWQWVQRHAALVAVTGFVISVGLSSLAIYDVHRQQTCLAEYLNGTLPKAQAVTDATQQLFNDVADHSTPAKFYADLKIEQSAADALTQYRATHSPKEACP